MSTHNFDEEIACGEYVCAIRDIEAFTGKGIYALDNRRTKLHDKLCRLFGLTKDETKEVTDNLDRINYNPKLLYCALCVARNKKRAKTQKGE